MRQKKAQERNNELQWDDDLELRADECPDCGGKVKEGELCIACHLEAEAELDAFFGSSK